MSATATITFTANNKHYEFTFPHSAEGDGAKVLAFLKANKIKKKDMQNCHMILSNNPNFIYNFTL